MSFPISPEAIHRNRPIKSTFNAQCRRNESRPDDQMPASSAPHSKVVGLRPSSKYCITSVTISQAEEDPASR